MKRMHRQGSCAGLILVLLLSGCTSYFPVNASVERLDRKEGYRSSRRWSEERSNDVLFILAFSGGGTRAASFAYGVLEELDATAVEVEGRKTSLLDEVDHITGVSGGSFPAAYYGLHGRRIFDDFEDRFLRRDVQGALITQLLWPWNWALLFSPYFERSELVARYYDRILFDGATFADMGKGAGPLIQINATDLATGAPFSFIQDQFDYLCSDLASYPVSRAVAASSAVPGPMSPLTLRNFAGSCDFESPDWIAEAMESRQTFSREFVNAKNLDSYTRSRERRFIRLIDGGVSDNLGVRGPFEGTLLRLAPAGAKPSDLGGLKHLVLILVNSATAPETVWEEIDTAPALFDIIDQTATVQINRYTIETIELLRSTFKSWRRAAANWDEKVGFHLIELDFTRPADPAERQYLNELPTSFRLKDEDIDRLRSAGREILRADPGFKEFVEHLGGRVGPSGRAAQSGSSLPVEPN
ncbi:MAG: patatin-like phospholipase family protein [Myxococcota bacterium]